MKTHEEYFPENVYSIKDELRTFTASTERERLLKQKAIKNET